VSVWWKMLPHVFFMSLPLLFIFILMPGQFLMLFLYTRSCQHCCCYICCHCCCCCCCCCNCCCRICYCCCLADALFYYKKTTILSYPISTSPSLPFPSLPLPCLSIFQLRHFSRLFDFVDLRN